MFLWWTARAYTYTKSKRYHDSGTWTHFSCYWPFVPGIHVEVTPITEKVNPCYTPVTPAKLTRNWPQTNTNHQIGREIGLQSSLVRFCRFGVGLCLGKPICQGEIFQTCLKDLSPTNCRLSVGYMPVWCGFFSGSVRGRVGLNSATDGRWFVSFRSFMYWAYVGWLDTDSRPIQNQIESDKTLNCMELAITFPNQSWQVSDISRTQTECKPITICGVIPIHIKTHKKFWKISLHQSGTIKWKWHFRSKFAATKQ